MPTEIKKPPQPVEKSREHHLVERAQQFWAKNSKFIVYGLTGLVLLVAGYFVYQNSFQAPQEKKAIEAIWKAEQYYRMDSARLALNGDGSNLGFLRIISRYGGTKAGNLAKFYAGSCYIKIGDYKNAVKYLKDFSTDDKLLKIRATGLLGDAYSEMGNKEQAVKNYKEAGTIYELDEFNSPEYLFRAGYLYQDMGKNKEAIEMFRMIKEKYPTSQRGAEIDKYLARLGELD